MQAQVAVVPYLGGIMIMDQKNPCFVKGMFRGVSKIETNAWRLVSALQREEVRKNEVKSHTLNRIGLISCLNGTENAELRVEQVAHVRDRSLELRGRRSYANKEECVTFFKGADIGEFQTLADWSGTLKLAGARRENQLDGAGRVRKEPNNLDRVREVSGTRKRSKILKDNREEFGHGLETCGTTCLGVDLGKVARNLQRSPHLKILGDQVGSKNGSAPMSYDAGVFAGKNELSGEAKIGSTRTSNFFGGGGLLAP
ncbi:hypothetical protein CASFOL_001427 [Castilleja foliolosa]|uniref:Uncharacterized protein n=1 Tax=Castilleja foliolosa TaxID=1961234 RepID=A0ABD3EJT7_9LAMI